MVCTVSRPCSSLKGRSGNGGVSPPPSHTQTIPPVSCTGKWTTCTAAQNWSCRRTWVGASTTQPDTSSFQPW